MSDSIIAVKPATKNNVTLSTTPVEIKRGSSKGIKYPIVQIPIIKDNAEAQLAAVVQYLTFRGPAVVAKALNSIEKQDGQQALNSACEWDTRKVLDPKDNKEVDQDYVTGTDEEKYWQYYLADTMRGGITLEDMQDELDEKSAQARELMAEFVKPSTPMERKMAIGTEVAELTTDIQNIEQQINERKAQFANRGRKKKETAAPATVNA